MKTIFHKLKPKFVHYRRYTGFSNVDYKKKHKYINTNKGLEKFLQISINTTDQIAPSKKKYMRGNDMLF